MIAFILIIFSSLVLQAVFPWWSLAIGAALVAYFFSRKIWHAFLQGFLAVFLLWFSFAFWLSSGNEHLLAERISQIFGVTQPLLILVFTGFIGGITGGLGALTGALWREGFLKKQPPTPNL